MRVSSSSGSCGHALQHTFSGCWVLVRSGRGTIRARKTKLRKSGRTRIETKRDKEKPRIDVWMSLLEVRDQRACVLHTGSAPSLLASISSSCKRTLCGDGRERQCFCDSLENGQTVDYATSSYRTPIFGKLLCGSACVERVISFEHVCVRLVWLAGAEEPSKCVVVHLVHFRLSLDSVPMFAFRSGLHRLGSSSKLVFSQRNMGW